MKTSKNILTNHNYQKKVKNLKFSNKDTVNTY